MPCLIKGIQKHVVVVKTPEPEIFEEAIFVVKESYIKNAHGSQIEVMRQAELTAERFLAENLPQKRKERRSKKQKVSADL